MRPATLEILRQGADRAETFPFTSEGARASTA
jgi:hypothetical protein